MQLSIINYYLFICKIEANELLRLSMLYLEMTNNIDNIDWNKVIKKEARGINDHDLGEVQGMELDNVITERGIAEKIRFAIPKSLVSYFDGHKVVFNLSEQDELRYAVR